MYMPILFKSNNGKSQRQMMSFYLSRRDLGLFVDLMSVVMMADSLRTRLVLLGLNITAYQTSRGEMRISIAAPWLVLT